MSGGSIYPSLFFHAHFYVSTPLYCFLVEYLVIIITEAQNKGLLLVLGHPYRDYLYERLTWFPKYITNYQHLCLYPYPYTEMHNFIPFLFRLSLIDFNSVSTELRLLDFSRALHCQSNRQPGLSTLLLVL